MDDRSERALLALVLPEVALLVGLGAVLAASLVGDAGALAGVSRPVRAALLAVVVADALIPAWVYLDLRRRGDDPSHLWVHAAMLPVLNLFGLLAYLDDRSRRGTE